MLKEHDICPECGDGWMITQKEKLICSHCGYECFTKESTPVTVE